jgi:hypothetical protein
MSFRDFDLPRVQHEFGIQLRMNLALFTEVKPTPISSALASFWQRVLPLGLGQTTEKARSELVTAPLLAEVWPCSQRQVVVISGADWQVDTTVGLNGVADFVLCRSSLMIYITAPVLVGVEAKRDSISDGLGQCAAEMVAAQRFNQKAGMPIDPIYGCVTTGANWRFLRLATNQLDIDIDEYLINQPERILGILLHCCGVSV